MPSIIQPRLDTLPLNVVEIVLEFLNLQSVKSLRCVCQALGQNCIGPHFKKHLHHQTIDLSKSSLESLSSLVSHGSLGSAVKDLAIAARVNDDSHLNHLLRYKYTVESTQNGGNEICKLRHLSSEELDRVQSTLTWMENEHQNQLAAPFDEIVERLSAILRRLKTINSIRLDAIFVQGPDSTVLGKQIPWMPFWIRPSQVFHITMTAIVKSKVTIDNLMIYAHNPRVGIPLVDITALMNELEREPTLLLSTGIPIKKLSLQWSTRIASNVTTVNALQGHSTDSPQVSLSPRGLIKDPKELDDGCEEDFPGIARLLHRMPNLESVDLHVFRTHNVHPTINERVFHHLVDRVRLPSLEQFSLKGLSTPPEVLRRSLENHPRLTTLHFATIHMASGTWQPVFDLMTHEMPSLRRLFMSNVWDNAGMLNLRPEDPTVLPDQYPSPPDFGDDLPETATAHRRRFEAEDIQRGLRFETRLKGHLTMSPTFLFQGH